MFNKGAKRENVINLVIHLMYKSAVYYVGNYRNKYTFWFAKNNKWQTLVNLTLW